MRAFATILLAAGGLATAGCSDPTTPLDDTAGLQFTIGAESQFSSAGYPAISGNDVDASDFAVAFPDSLGGLVIAGFELAEGTRGDLFVLQLVDVSTDDATACGITNECHGRLLVGIDAANLSDIDEVWTLTSGSVSITQAGSATVTGTFQDFVYTGDGGTELLASGGSFEIPLLSESQGRDIMKCFLARATGGTCET